MCFSGSLHAYLHTENHWEWLLNVHVQSYRYNYWMCMDVQKLTRHLITKHCNKIVQNTFLCVYQHKVLFFKLMHFISYKVKPFSTGQPLKTCWTMFHSLYKSRPARSFQHLFDAFRNIDGRNMEALWNSSLTSLRNLLSQQAVTGPTPRWHPPKTKPRRNHPKTAWRCCHAFIL